ncbi:MAG TPA: hypothetical protein ENH15_00860 [Actinobacteria bacterium]|nr:hypothetical protein [Actinomycetota bacterium]
MSFTRKNNCRSSPTYSFFGNGTANQAIRPGDLPVAFPATLRVLHVGSYSMACEPIGLALTALMEREKGQRLLSLDPNVRPSMVGDRAAYLGKLHHWVELADLVKFSRADAVFVLPNGDSRDLIERWLGCGPGLVVLTAGGDEIVGATRSSWVTVDVPHVKVADTVGAGDAFMSGLLAWLRDSGRLNGRGDSQSLGRTSWRQCSRSPRRWLPSPACDGERTRLLERR